MSSNDYEGARALSWIAQRHREDLAKMPEKLRKEAQERAQERAASKPTSYLATHLRALYGV